MNPQPGNTTPASLPPTRMFTEAAEAADAIAHMLTRNAAVIDRLAVRLRAAPPPFVVTCARGSSDHAATFAKYVIETQLGVVTASASPSVASLYATTPRLVGALYLAISQSGRSPDLLRSARAARDAGACVVAMVNAEDSPLAAAAEIVIPLHAGIESSVAATKSYVCALAAILHLAAHWKRDTTLEHAVNTLPELLHAAWRVDWSALSEGLAEARNLFVLGRGLGFGVALEAALKLKETCGIHAEAFSTAEVRHGPMALVGPGFPVLVFAQQDESLASTLELAAEFRGRGAHVWIAAPEGDGQEHLAVPAAVHSACTPIAEIVSFYRATNALALRRGYNPDVPPHLQKVTETL
ncbi:SIS domain-containing protein [Metallibacterium sp.]|nr:SIS domain-containing protein [Metallibacterium sp.]